MNFSYFDDDKKHDDDSMSFEESVVEGIKIAVDKAEKEHEKKEEKKEKDIGDMDYN